MSIHLVHDQTAQFQRMHKISWKSRNLLALHSNSRCDKVVTFNIRVCGNSMMIEGGRTVLRSTSPAQRCAVGLLLLTVVLASGSTLAAPASHSSLVVLLDASGSMRKTDPSGLRVEAFELLLALSKDGDRMALCEFGEGVRDLSGGFVDVGPATREKLASDAARCGNSDRSTDVLAALRHADDLVSKLTADERAAYPPVVLFLTDGRDDLPGSDPARNDEIDNAARAIAQAGARIYGLGLSRDADRTLFRRLELATGGETFYAASSTDLLEGFFSVSRALAGRWLVHEGESGGDRIHVEVPSWAKGVTVAWFASSGMASGDLTVNGAGPALRRPLYQLVSLEGFAGGNLDVRVPHGAGKLIVDARGELLLQAVLPGSVVRNLPFACSGQVMSAPGTTLGQPMFLERATSRLRLVHDGADITDAVLYDDGAHDDKAARDGMFGANALDAQAGAGTWELSVRAPFSPVLASAGKIEVLAEPVRVVPKGPMGAMVDAMLGRGAILTLESVVDVPLGVSLAEGGSGAPEPSRALAPRAKISVSTNAKPPFIGSRSVPLALHVDGLVQPVWTGSVAIPGQATVYIVLLAVGVAAFVSTVLPQGSNSKFRVRASYKADFDADAISEMVALDRDGFPAYSEIPAPLSRAVRILPPNGIWDKSARLLLPNGDRPEFVGRRAPKAGNAYKLKNGMSWKIRSGASQAEYTFYSGR